MEVKHKPSTALPWKARKDGNKKDWAYVAHACNSYPRLVEALRGLLKDCDEDLKPMGKHPARALLRELGEDV